MNLISADLSTAQALVLLQGDIISMFIEINGISVCLPLKKQLTN